MYTYIHMIVTITNCFFSKHEKHVYRMNQSSGLFGPTLVLLSACSSVVVLWYSCLYIEWLCITPLPLEPEYPLHPAHIHTHSDTAATLQIWKCTILNRSGRINRAHFWRKACPPVMKSLLMVPWPVSYVMGDTAAIRGTGKAHFTWNSARLCQARPLQHCAEVGQEGGALDSNLKDSWAVAQQLHLTLTFGSMLLL